MNFNNKFNGNEFKKKNILIIGIIVFLLVGLVFSYFYFQKPKDNVEPNKETPNIIEEVIEDEEEPIEMPQEETFGVLKANVFEIRDLSTKIEYGIKVGVNEAMIDSRALANSKTSFIDLNKKTLINPSSILVGSEVVIYGVGNYNVGNITASLIALGSDTSYRYGELSGIIGDLEQGYEYTLSNITDKLKISADCKVYDSALGEEVTSMDLIKVGDRLLFKYAPDFEIMPYGNLYTCTEIVVIVTNE